MARVKSRLNIPREGTPSRIPPVTRRQQLSFVTRVFEQRQKYYRVSPCFSGEGLGEASIWRETRAPRHKHVTQLRCSQVIITVMLGSLSFFLIYLCFGIIAAPITHSICISECLSNKKVPAVGIQHQKSSNDALAAAFRRIDDGPKTMSWS